MKASLMIAVLVAALALPGALARADDNPSRKPADCATLTQDLDIDLKQVLHFVGELRQHFRANRAALLAEIAEKGTLKKDGLKERLIEEIKSFKTTWHA